MNWKEHIGKEVVFTGKIKMLDEGSIGILSSVFDDKCSIIYPQNYAYEADDNGGWKLKKNAPNKVSSHSALLTEIKLVIV